LLEILTRKGHKVQKLVVASSMSVYGEGQYYCESCAENRFPKYRDPRRLELRQWECACDVCNGKLIPVATTEEKPLMPSSIYAMSKRHQEEMCLLTGKTFGIPTVALRFFNTYGPGQSLSNPYTGACGIFSSRILSGKNPYIFEDGGQLRDFVHVNDVARAIQLSLQKRNADYVSLNIGTGAPTSILEVARLLAKSLHSNLKPHVSEKSRKGDVRHCFADITLARKLLGFEPRTNLDEGLSQLAEWIRNNPPATHDEFDRSLYELQSRNLA
jgi:dTDP-L-rhamnose 4-epimerase